VAPWRVVNVGAGSPCRLMDFIDEIERSLELAAQRRYVAFQPGDSPITFADTTLLETLTGYRPDTPPPVDVTAFCDWYREYYQAS
jgi:UDP-glucuronate 4-epimerase